MVATILESLFLLHQPLAGSAPVAVPAIVVVAPELNVGFGEVGTVKTGDRPLDPLRCKLKRLEISGCGVAGVFLKTRQARHRDGDSCS